MKKAILTTLALIGAVLLAHADKKDDYRRFTDTIRAEVYAMDLPAFKVKEIPAKYKGESAVIKAIYEEVNARKKTGFGRASGSLLAFTRKAQVRGNQLTRMLVHINDKAALEKYSELDFDTDKKSTNWDGYEKKKHAMGVRLIKPDGRTVDIDTSEFVEVAEGKKGEKKSRKLAIPGLEIGDDIDVFYYTESKLQNVHPDPVTFSLRSSEPVMNYKIHCVVDDNLTTQYRSLNGAPDFNVSRDDDKNYVLDLEMTDIDKEPRLWYDSDQQSPAIKMYIFNRRNSDEFTPESARKDGLQDNPDAAAIQNDRWYSVDGWRSYYKDAGPYAVRSHLRDGKKIKSALEKLVKSGKMSQAEATDYVYNLLCYIYMSKRFRRDDHLFAIQFNTFLNSCKIPVEEGMSTSDYEEDLDQLINFKNARLFARPEADHSRLYFPPSALLAPSEIHPSFQGRNALMWRKEKDRKKQPPTESDYFCVPMSTADDNRNVTTVDATIEGTALKIKRTESYLGATKPAHQALLSEEDVNEGYKAYLNRHGIEVDVKEGKKDAADRAERYADGRREQAEDFKKEIHAYHNADASEFGGGKVLNIGIDPEKPEYIYEIDYTMDNLVKRAGKNLILSTGKLLSGQVEALPSDRKRSDDIYMRTPREYVSKINVKIPAGYSVNARSLAALDRSVSNEAGCFTVCATTPSADMLSIVVTKRYAKPHLPASEWEELLKVLDAANAWQTSTLVLDKK